jgi:hypothetical protein
VQRAVRRSPTIWQYVAEWISFDDVEGKLILCPSRRDRVPPQRDFRLGHTRDPSGQRHPVHCLAGGPLDISVGLSAIPSKS